MSFQLQKLAGENFRASASCISKHRPERVVEVQGSGFSLGFRVQGLGLILGLGFTQHRRSEGEGGIKDGFWGSLARSIGGP